MAQNSFFGAQPFEELANEEEPMSPTSLEDFYKEQERKDLERRLSKSRPSLRRRRGRSKSLASGEGSVSAESPRSPEPIEELPAVAEPEEKQPTPPPEQQTLSWHRERQQTGQWSTPEHSFKQHYEIHNNTPPPFPWINHHLRTPGTPWPPPSHPRKQFTMPPALPPPSTTNGKDTPGNTSFNSSSSSLPKSTSTTNLSPPAVYGRDHVDMLDPSDPWGMRWHHDGRYDVGDLQKSSRENSVATWAGTSSPAVEVNHKPNPKGAPGPPQFLRTGPKTPSPLSQSTSAVQIKNHSSISLDTPKQLSRRLSKRGSRSISQPGTPLPDLRTGDGKRTSGFRGLFSTSTPTGIDRRRSKTLGTNDGTSVPMGNIRPPSKTLTTPQPASGQRISLTPSPTKEKRSSYLGRLVKKFSIIRHSSSDSEPRMTMITPPGVSRSMSTANGIHAPKEDALHPRYASAPDTAHSPISLVPEVRLTQPSVDGGHEDSSVPLPGQYVHEQALSEGRSSPEPHLPHFGGLMVTNPDANASEVESMASPRPRRVTLASSSPRPSEMLPPRMPFLNAGLDSAGSSPATQITPLRVVNGQDPETETEGGTILASPLTIRESLASPQDSRLSLHSDARRSMYSESSDVRLLSSVIPSIPDLPTISPFNPAQMLAKSPSPRVKRLEPSLNRQSSNISSSTGSTLNQTKIQLEDPSEPPTPQELVKPTELPRTLETAKSAETFRSRPRSTYSTTTNQSTVDSVDLASTADASGENFARPTARKNSVSHVSRYAAYYSPDTYPSVALPLAPQAGPSPVPTPPARLPLHLLQESDSREKLRELAQRKERAKTLDARQNTESISRPHTEPIVEPRKSRDLKQDKSKASQEAMKAKEKRNESTFRVPGEGDIIHHVVREISSVENSSRAPVEASYNATSSRPSPLRKKTLPGTPPQRPSDDDTSSDQRRRASTNTAYSDQKSAANAQKSDDVRQRVNSTHASTGSGANGSGSSTNGQSRSTRTPSAAAAVTASAPGSKSKEEAKSKEDDSKVVIPGLGQNWEVVEAVMIQPSKSSAKRQNSHHRDNSSGGSASWASTLMSNNYPARSSSRPGYNVLGEPIRLASPTRDVPPSPVPSSPAPSVPAKRSQTLPTQAKEPTPSVSASLKKQESRSRSQLKDSKEGENRKDKGVDDKNRKPEPVTSRSSRSKSRSRDASLLANVNLNKPVPPRPPPTPATEAQPLPSQTPVSPKDATFDPNSYFNNKATRRASVTKSQARPSSEIVPAGELGAHEAWEHNRMTARGQSIVLPDGYMVGSVAPSSHRSSTTSSVLMPNGSAGSAGAGSAHTSFMVQPPFQPRVTSSSNHYYPQPQPVANPLPAPPAKIVPPNRIQNRF